MAQKFKPKDFVKVIGKDSKHFDKVGMITNQFHPRGKEVFNVIHFSDESPGTIKSSDLEKIEMNGPMIMVPKIKESNTVYITESDGMVHVYTSGNVVSYSNTSC
jgi:hypothetical protein